MATDKNKSTKNKSKDMKKTTSIQEMIKNVQKDNPSLKKMLTSRNH